MTTIIGIDPGKDGAIAFFELPDEKGGVCEHGLPSVEDCPCVNGKPSAAGMRDLLGYALTTHCRAYIERVGAMPKQGVSSTFNFGMGVGMWHGALAALRVSTTLVTPQEWKREMRLIGKGKEDSRELALLLFPGLSKELARKKDHGRAEALLIAEYGRRVHTGTLQGRLAK